MSEKQVSEIRECVMELLSHHMRRAWTATELATELKLEGKTKKTFQKRLQELVVDGSIVNVRGDRYSLGAAADLASGTISIARSGNGYLSSPDLDRDLFIPQSQMGVALPGDRVLARIEAPTGRHKDDPPAGRIIRVLERRKRDIVGTLKSTGRFNYIIPTAPGYTKNFYVTDTLKAKVGDRVVVRFIDWPNKHVNPEAEIIDIIGPADDPSVDTISIIRQYELPGEFPDAVTREAEDVAASLDRPGQRRDLRETLIIRSTPNAPGISTMPSRLSRTPRGGGCWACISPTSRTSLIPAPHWMTRPVSGETASICPIRSFPCCRSSCPTGSAACAPMRTGWPFRLS